MGNDLCIVEVLEVVQFVVISILSAGQVRGQTSGFGSGEGGTDAHSLLQEDVHGFPVPHYTQLLQDTLRYDIMSYHD